ncbi:hypothetical protein B6U99_00225 [Candidatus Geothermarchaeota archaeon ex4572_27]|nr:MAG: hypothetical protein B6U99_00225 [Candidatus Geothermarchaeota archaeon ex4572_27]
MRGFLPRSGIPLALASLGIADLLVGSSPHSVPVVVITGLMLIASAVLSAALPRYAIRPLALCALAANCLLHGYAAASVARLSAPAAAAALYTAVSLVLLVASVAVALRLIS